MGFEVVYESPVGKLFIKANHSHITHLIFWDKPDPAVPERSPARTGSNQILKLCVCELKQYFAGRLQHFTVPLQPEGTVFRRRVWEALQQIPYGETISYKQLAINIGNPNAARAVGGANHHNPISIIIPCHRVIGSSGVPVGYGGGLDKKTYLLALERGM